MPDQILPATLREALCEPLERLSARVAILRYLDALPLTERGPDHAGFCEQLETERDMLQRVITRVLAAWRRGVVSIADASAILQNASTFART